MTDDQFLISKGSKSFDLPVNTPWGSPPRSGRVRLRIGLRCAVSLSRSEDATAFVAAYPSGTSIARSGHVVHVSAQSIGDEWDVYAVFDLWIEERQSSTAVVRSAFEALNVVRAEIAADVDRARERDTVKQEFLELKLPSHVVRILKPDEVRGAVGSQVNTSGSERPRLGSVTLADGTLTFGPEHPGVVEAVASFLDQELGTSSDDAQPRFAGYRWLRAIPVAMAVVLLTTWALPLHPASAAAIVLILIGLQVLALWPWNVIGWRRLLKRPEFISACGFLGIGLFGGAYALCGSIVKGSLGTGVQSLGIPFLIASGVGIAGGVIGDNPTGPAKTVAHVQLLLAMGGVAAAVALLLRIEFQTRRPTDRQ